MLVPAAITRTTGKMWAALPVIPSKLGRWGRAAGWGRRWGWGDKTTCKQLSSSTSWDDDEGRAQILGGVKTARNTHLFAPCRVLFSFGCNCVDVWRRCNTGKNTGKYEEGDKYILLCVCLCHQPGDTGRMRNRAQSVDIWRDRQGVRAKIWEKRHFVWRFKGKRGIFCTLT